MFMLWVMKSRPVSRGLMQRPVSTLKENTNVVT